MGLSSMLGQNKLCFKNKIDPISHKKKYKKKSFGGVMIYYTENTHILCIYEKTKTFILLCDVNILDLRISPTMARIRTFQIFLYWMTTA